MFFDDLTAREIKLLEKIGVARSYPTGAKIIEEGTPGTSFSIILTGRVEVRKNLNERQSKVVAELTTCDLVGELGFFGAPARSADVVAVAECQVLEFQREAFDAFAAENPKLGEKIYRNMARILANRMVSTSVELKDAIVWSIARETDRTRFEGIRQNVRLRFRP